ncbi:MAG: hypothetical protein HY236_04780 [Acidobacteria bacterium]|nr:hypothetical protein [Acidobacteriota bacterium]
MELLNREHAGYRSKLEMWQRYLDFYVGGEQLRRNASRYLVRRQKEPNDVYQERLLRVFYENYLGSIVDWYAATLFRNEPILSFEGPAEFYSEFLADADLEGRSFLEFCRRAFIDALVFQQSYALIDFPKVTGQAKTRGEEDALGKSRAYLVSYSPMELINWKLDRRGNFDWVVLRTESTYQPEFLSGEEIVERRWMYYDRQNFRVYAQNRSSTQKEAGQPEAALMDEGRHGLAEMGRVPVMKLELTEGLWLANKAGLLQQEHFNKSNGLSWALDMGLFAMPVIYSEREWHQIVGEAYYIQLGPEDKFSWTEPQGHVYGLAAENLGRLKDEIYRVCYVMVQAAGREARNVTQSAASKQRDQIVTQEVLRAYGDLVKDFMRQTLRLIATARKDEVKVEVAGLDQFDVKDFTEELGNAQTLSLLVTGSNTFSREMQKRLALRYLEDSSQDVKNKVAGEIDNRL